MAAQVRLSSLRVWSLVALLAVAATCAVLAMAPTKANAAGSGPYCTGVLLEGHNHWCDAGFGVPNTYQLVGSGLQHSVCVWMAAGSVQCSPGPNQAVYNTSMSGCGLGCGIPSIKNNGYSPNRVYGYFYYS
jgi:hypothetical protein